jgi:hypothetical protein
MCNAARSAFEEACARLERRYANLPRPFGDLDRQLKRDMAGWTDGMSMAVPLTRADSAALGLSMTDVTVSSSDWLLQVDVDESRRTGALREVALLELTMSLTAQAGSRELTRTGSARRFMAAHVDPESQHARLRIQPTDMALALGASPARPVPSR